MAPNYKKFMWICFILAVTLRLLLFWANPPRNAFDDHFEPIFMIIDQGTPPDKEACIECCQPPVFYFTSAMIGKVMLKAGLTKKQILKPLQFLSCLFGILTLVVISMILRKVPLSDFSRCAAFGTVCFLPRHIYMSAIHSNDTLSYLLVALCLYLLLVTIEKKFSLPWLIGLSLTITVTLFSKYTTIVVLAAIVINLAVIYLWNIIIQRRRVFIPAILLLFIPLGFIGYDMFLNIQTYGIPTPRGPVRMESQLPGKDRISFLDFKPCTTIRTPILAPDNIDSFWTIVYSRMWFDMEPKFLYYTDPIDPGFSWWKQYTRYLQGLTTHFPDPNQLSQTTRVTGAALISLGLLPLILFLIGMVLVLFGKAGFRAKENREKAVKMQIFPVLFLFNTMTLVLYVGKFPFFGHMKAYYLLISMPAFAVLTGAGAMYFENRRIMRRIIVVLLGTLYTAVHLHILHIVSSIMGIDPALL